jgi:hypothetical protein
MANKKKVTLKKILAAVEADACLGFCTGCGATAHNVEPDARNYTCESCGEAKVFGAEELLLCGGEPPMPKRSTRPDYYENHSDADGGL